MVGVSTINDGRIFPKQNNVSNKSPSLKKDHIKKGIVKSAIAKMNSLQTPYMKRT